MIKFFKTVLNFTINSTKFAFFLFTTMRSGFRTSKLEKLSVKNAIILANGPSLKKIRSKIVNLYSTKDTDFVVMNFFACDQLFFQLKPKHYCFTDAIFYEKSIRLKEVLNVFDILEKADWEIFIYLTGKKCDYFIKFANLKNKNIKIIKINSTGYLGFEKFRNYFYKTGYAIPATGNVSILAIFVALNRGFKKIELFGVDHNFFDSICVKDSVLCYRDTHFYEEKKAAIIPIVNEQGVSRKVSEYIEMTLLMFKSHDLLAQYANYLGVDIINRTENSLIDSYKTKD